MAVAVGCEMHLAQMPTDSVNRMCRNITTLRGLEPPATVEEVEAAARQFVRKVTGIQKTSAATTDAFEEAVHDITAVTTRLLGTLPARRGPSPTLPPLRRPEVRARLGLEPSTFAAS